MAIIKIPFKASKDLANEIEFFDGKGNDRSLIANSRTQDDLVKKLESMNDYLDVARIPSLFQLGRVLDIGVADGFTSAYLSIKGFDVTCVEPSMKFCEVMERNFIRLGLSIRIVNGTAEVLAQLNREFDLVVFSASLHHCDDMPAALQVARQCLREGGRLFLFEPVLKCYRTKKWFYRTLVEHPEQLGHYGGNEHTYRFGEYISALRTAGFREIGAVPSAAYGRSAERASWDTPGRYVIKSAYYWFARNIICKVGLLRWMFIRLSLINPVITATK